MQSHPWLRPAAICMLAWGAGSARGEEPRAGPMEMRVFDLAALTAGRTDFFAPSMGICTPGMGPEDETECQFGDSEEPSLPMGTAEEIRERLMSEVQPSSWFGSDGADMLARGGNRLWVRNVPTVQQDLGAVLARWEAEILGGIVVEVVVFRAATDLAACTLEEQLSSGERAAAVSFSMLQGQRAFALDGRRRAFPAQHLPVAGTNGTLWDPGVGVVTIGLLVECRPTLAPPGERIDLELSIRWVEPLESSMLSGAGKRPVESPRVREHGARQQVAVIPGRWSLVPAAPRVGDEPGWAVAVRARRLTRAPRAPSSGTRLPTVESVEGGALQTRAFDISSFQRSLPPHLHFAPGEVLPSGATQTGAWEQTAPRTLVPHDALAAAVRALTDREAAWDEPRRLEASQASLLAHAPRPMLDRVGNLLQSLESVFVRPVEIEVRVVDAPTGLVLDQHPTLAQPEARALAVALANGTARLLDHARLVSFDSHGVTLHAGERELYVRDLESRSPPNTVDLIAERMPLLDGMAIDVVPALLSTDDSVLTEVRFLRSWVERPIRRVRLPEGELELPDVRMLRVHTTVEIPLGETRVLCAARSADRRTLVLLSARRIVTEAR